MLVKMILIPKVRPMAKAVLKVHKKGIIVLPKWIRERVGVNEGDALIAEVKGLKIVLEPLKPRRVKLGGRISRIVWELKKEEVGLE